MKNSSFSARRAAASRMDTLSLARELIRRPSVSPPDAGCQTLIAELLGKAGFTTERLRFGEVDNLWARRGRAAPALVFAGHTDVVPSGTARAVGRRSVRGDGAGRRLIGRGAADMKGSLAAMINACRRFVERYPQIAGLDRHADHERRGRRGRRRHAEGHGDAGEPRRDVSVLRRRRAVERRRSSATRSDRPARQPVGHHDDPRRARSRRLSARRPTTRSTRSRSSSPR